MRKARQVASGYLDFTRAVVLTAGAEAEAVERQAALMLRWEVQQRTGLAWPEVSALPAGDTPVIVVGSRERLPALPPGAALPEPVAGGAGLAEGYVLATGEQAPVACAIGNDRRGTLFAVGRLLRLLDWGPGRAALPGGLAIATAPAYPMRGMQLGYRRLNDTLDAWDVGEFAQYVRDLIIFGNNAVELIPPVSPGRVGLAELDPLMPMTPWDMTIALCAVLDAYDMDVWFWLPLESGAAEEPGLREASLREREALFAACQRIDHLFVPGGDPGDTPPELLFPYLEDLGQRLHRHHPQAAVWVSPQKFRRERLEAFYRYLEQHQPEWLAGVVWGPGCLQTLAQTRQRVPARYPVRHYPDVTHAKICQFPFPYWDEVWARAYERQPIHPRPTQFAHICRLHSPHTPGSVAYSDGTGDDVNKMVWNALLWDPQVEVREVLRDYGRCFVAPEQAEAVAEGLLMLEQNWVGPAATNPQVAKSLAHWQAIEKAVGRQLPARWRLQQALVRAYGDAYVQKRVQQEQAVLDRVYAVLARSPEIGPTRALARAEKLLARADPLTAAPGLHRRLHELAGMLFASIGMQLETERYGASSLDRGAQLDNNEGALTDCAWLRHELPRLRALGGREAQLAAINRLVHWTDPGPGGYYDDLGNRANGADPHLLREITWEQDPGFLVGIQDSHYGPGFPTQYRRSWCCQAHGYRPPLRMRYQGLDPQGRYLFRATYAGRGKMSLQLYLGGEKVGEPVACDGREPVVREFPVPLAAVAGGTLEVLWDSVLGTDVQIAEAWLIRTG